ncbi:photosystem II reaction center Psb28 protein-like [Rutidosis leptorrhynchoides]|uniref:photosystem II reaction center Psb28 protein-like n=1 Tax=Rutidosis leptorrhynchoides TaxID=125765 RepID=UPI003A994EA7
MATLQSVALSSPVSHYLQQQQQQQPPSSLSVMSNVVWLLMQLVERSNVVSLAYIVLQKVGRVSCSTNRIAQYSFNGQSLHFLSRRRQLPLIRRNSQFSLGITMMVKPVIQFVQGTDEQTVPDVKLTKSRDGTNGMAIFRFEQPSVFDSSGEIGDITGFYMIDEEGVLQSVDVNAKFVNGRPAGIEAKYIMRSPREWDRFMRFMERYANANGLQFVKS